MEQLRDEPLQPRLRPVNRGYVNNDVPVIGPIGIAAHVDSRPRRVLHHDDVRHGVLFHNPNPDVLIRVFPEGAELHRGEGGIVMPPFDFLELYASSGGRLGEDQARVRINCPWQAVCDDPDPRRRYGLTIWDFTDRGDPAPPVASLNVDVGIRSPMGLTWTAIGPASTHILAPRQNRRGLLFHNPGSHRKGIAPSNLEASLGAGSIVLQPKAQKELHAFGKIRMNAGFNAVTANNADGSLTALEYV